jgi:hypothetical protein
MPSGDITKNWKRRIRVGHSDKTTLGFKHRNALKLMTMANHKTPKGEGDGYLTAILYLMPHTSGGGITLCPHSTPACRDMCLAGAGMSGLPRQLAAKQRRTDMWNNQPVEFISGILEDIERLRAIANKEGVEPVVRLNGTSDILWERLIDMAAFPGITFYDYTKVPIEKRQSSENYRLTYSVGGPEDMQRALGYLARGQSIAMVTTEDQKNRLADVELKITEEVWATFVDGDAISADRSPRGDEGAGLRWAAR